MLLDLNVSELFERYLESCEEVGADAECVRRVSEALLRRYQGKSMSSEQEKLSWILEKRWYDSLSGTPAWDVYADDCYLGELWACWKMYSRRYLREIRSDKSLFGKSIVEDLGRPSVVVDLGCGPGLTTAALTELFPHAIVIGTNLPGLKQTEIAKKIGRSRGFRIAIDLEQTEEPVDLVFASEYFEHFQNPLEHLEEVMKKCRPKSLLIANAFSSPSTGHFPEYEAMEGLLELKVSGREISRRFNERLRCSGCEKVATGLWNNRPAYWKMQGRRGRS